ncbi:MAG: hypothetical protein AB1439_03395 [candidate division FCPU426 bacterium]
MESTWNGVFKKRMLDFERAYSVPENYITVSIKLRVKVGCFHRQHAPYAYAEIDKFLNALTPDQTTFQFEEHESGPEILVYLALTTAGISLAKSIIDLIAAIINAHSEGGKKGDRCPPLDLVVRHIQKDGQFMEEKVAQIGFSEKINTDEIERKFNTALLKLLENDLQAKRIKKSSKRRSADRKIKR